MRTTKAANNVTIAYYYDDGNLVAERRTIGSTSSWPYYLYGVDGIAGFRYNNTTYLFRKNIQGDVTHIYTESGTLVGQYAYDAWGNCEILQDANGIATLNPFRYRGYYFDQENDLYYLQSRYYDPETCRFVNADDISYLDPETIGGLNLYAYCGNNPVMGVDPEGTAWWEWLLGAVGVVFATAIAVAITATTAGVGSLVFAVAMGALKGAAIGLGIGAVAGATIGAIAGGIIAHINKTDFWTSVGEGALLGLGIGAFAGAIVGAIVGGICGALSYTTPSGLKLKAIDSAINKAFSDPNKVNHIMQSKHNLPQSIKGVRKLMRNTLINGKIIQYKSVQSAFWSAAGSEVIFKIIDGVIHISDMWIRK